MGFILFIDHKIITCFKLNQTTFAYCTYYKRTALKHSRQMKRVSIAGVWLFEVWFRRALNSCSAFASKFHLLKYKIDWRKTTIFLSAFQFWVCVQWKFMHDTDLLYQWMIKLEDVQLL